MEDLSNSQFVNKNFSGQDLTGAKLDHSIFICCNFDKAILNSADCSYSKFTGGTMIDTMCRDTNFSHSILNCIFKPKDAFGMTLTLKCETFRGMKTSAFWWYCFVQFALMMMVEKDSDGTDPKDSLIKSLGINKYLALKRMFQEREL